MDQGRVMGGSRAVVGRSQPHRANGEEAARLVLIGDPRLVSSTADTTRPNEELRITWPVRGALIRLFADLVAVFVAVVVCYLVRPSHDLTQISLFGLRVGYDTLAVLSVPVWLLSLAAAGAYRPRQTLDDDADYRLPVITAVEIMATVAIAAFALKLQLSRMLVVAYFPTLIVSVLLTRFAARKALGAARRRGHGVIRLVLVGAPDSVRKFADHLMQKTRHEHRIVGVCLASTERALETRDGPVPIAGRPDDVVSAAKRLRASSVAVVGQAHFDQETLQRVAWQLERSGIDLLVAPDVADLAGPRIRVTPVSGLPLLHITEPRIGGARRHVKSLYERLLAVPLLLVSAPVLALAAILILLDEGRPIFYRQRRIGLGGRPFEMFKFRTMSPDADERLVSLLESNEHDGALFKIRRDPRVTRSGRWLRKFSIDELPQLLNVIAGDMNLVGPRPCLERERESFGEAAERRFLAKPGMTGLWQVSGRSDIPWEDAVLLDLYYVENWSLFMDITITYRTLRTVLAGTGR